MCSSSRGAGSVGTRLRGEVLRHVSTLQSLSFCLQTRVKVVYKAQVYYWGGGVSVPTTLPLLPDSQMVDVSAGRMQWAGVTENGKLVFWEVRCMCVHVRSGLIFPTPSPIFLLPMSTVIIRPPWHNTPHHDTDGRSEKEGACRVHSSHCGGRRERAHQESSLWRRILCCTDPLVKPV